MSKRRSSSGSFQVKEPRSKVPQAKVSKRKFTTEGYQTKLPDERSQTKAPRQRPQANIPKRNCYGESPSGRSQSSDPHRFLQPAHRLRAVLNCARARALRRRRSEKSKFGMRETPQKTPSAAGARRCSAELQSAPGAVARQAGRAAASGAQSPDPRTSAHQAGVSEGIQTSYNVSNSQNESLELSNIRSSKHQVQIFNFAHACSSISKISDSTTC